MAVTILRCEACGREVDLTDRSANLGGYCDGEGSLLGMHVYEQVRIESIPNTVPLAWQKAS